MKRKRLVLTMVGLVLALGAGLVLAQNVKNFIDQGGARSVIGGTLQVVSGGTLKLDSGAILSISGQATAAGTTVMSNGTTMDDTAAGAVVFNKGGAGTVSLAPAGDTTNALTVAPKGAAALQMGGSSTTTGTRTVNGSVFTQDANGERMTLQSTQTIGAGGVIAADSCGGVKLVTAAGAVSTDTTNAFTAPAAGNTGCVMNVCNTGANTITIKHSTNSKTTTGGDLALAQNGCVDYLSTGTFWFQTAVMTTSS